MAGDPYPWVRACKVGGFAEVLGGSLSSWSMWCDLLPSPLGQVGLPDLHCFHRWDFDPLDILNDFTEQVVVSRRETGLRKWTGWLREDLGARPYVRLWLDFDPPPPFLVIKDHLTEASRIWVEPHLFGAQFRKAWMPFFCRSGHPVVTTDQFLAFVGHLLPPEPLLDLPRITGRDLREVGKAQKSTARGLDGWAWNEIKALPLPWFSGWALGVGRDLWCLATGSSGCLYCHDP